MPRLAIPAIGEILEDTPLLPVYGEKCRQADEERRRPSLPCPRSSDQPHALEAGVAAPADDDVVVNRHPERLSGLDDGPRHLDVGAGRGGIARGVVMQHR